MRLRLNALPKLPKWLLLVVTILLFATPALASNGGSHGGEHDIFLSILKCLLVLIVAHAVGTKLEEYGQSSVLGYLGIGVLITALTLRGLVANDSVFIALKEIAILLFMFEIGLETDLDDMKAVGWHSMLVAIIGVLAPCVLIVFALVKMFPEQSWQASLWGGTTSMATSVGITCMVLRSIGRLQSKAGRITLGAAVIDDVVGVVVLAVVTKVIKSGAFDPWVLVWTSLMAITFIVGSIFAGRKLAEPVSRAMMKICPETAGKLLFALSFGGVFALIATLMGLEPIIGAFAGGLVLRGENFRGYPAKEKVEHQLRAGREFIGPIYFIGAGMGIELQQLANPTIWGPIAVISALAIVGKLLSGIAVLKPYGKRVALAVGAGMTGRGEVGILFAQKGREKGAINDSQYATLMGMVVMTTLVAPYLIKWAFRGYVDDEQSETTEPVETIRELSVA